MLPNPQETFTEEILNEKPLFNAVTWSRDKPPKPSETHSKSGALNVRSQQHVTKSYFVFVILFLWN